MFAFTLAMLLAMFVNVNHFWRQLFLIFSPSSGFTCHKHRSHYLWHWLSKPIHLCLYDLKLSKLNKTIWQMKELPCHYEESCTLLNSGFCKHNRALPSLVTSYDGVPWAGIAGLWSLPRDRSLIAQHFWNSSIFCLFIAVSFVSRLKMNDISDFFFTKDRWKIY